MLQEIMRTVNIGSRNSSSIGSTCTLENRAKKPLAPRVRNPWQDLHVKSSGCFIVGNFE